MIISRAPLRLHLGGGGTDLPSYYSEYGGFLMSGAINRHMYIVFHRRSVEKQIKLKYSKIEIVDRPDQIQHPIFRAALQKFGINDSAEITSVADVGSGTGLGSSGCFTVTLLNALHAYRKNFVPVQELAEEAAQLEMVDLKLPSGKQDPYASAFGGLICMTLDKKGNVDVQDLAISPDTRRQFENNLLLYFTGYTRSSGEILTEQGNKISASKTETVEAMHQLRQIGGEIKKALESGNIDEYGPLIDEHWKVKKTISSRMTNPQIDRWYDLAKKNGATGGKIQGAGGGGFFMFYCPQEKQPELRKAMAKEGLTEMHFSFDMDGVKTLADFGGDL